MNRYLVTVKIQGQNVRTIIDADSAVHARLLVDYRFGMGSLIGQPVKAVEASIQYPRFEDVVAAYENTQLIKPIKPIKPAANPDQARINMLKQNKDRADAALKGERNRQKVQRTQKALFKLVR